MNYNTYGYVVYKNNQYQDICLTNNNLREYYCKSDKWWIFNKLGSKIYRCPNGCSNGICKENMCIPKTCSQLGKNCGYWDNGCNSNINCGSCSSNQVCNNGRCVENNDKCIKIFGKGNPDKTMNIFIVPINYQASKILYNKPYNLNDFSINFENDVNRLLFSDSKDLGYGLLTVEPFISHQDSVSIFILPGEYHFSCDTGSSDYVSFFIPKLESCMYYQKNDYVFGLISEKTSSGTTCLQCEGGINVACANRQPSAGGPAGTYTWAVTYFRHELGHQFGLYDIYGPPYFIEIIQGFNPNYGNGNFWEYYKEHVIPNDDETPNCDLTAGCPKWCSGEPKIIPQEVNLCQSYTSEEDCKAHGPGIIGGYDCVWFPTKHPYFNTQCISMGSSQVDIGQNCIDGAGCYFGCFGLGFRSDKYQDLATQWIDPNGNKHGYDAAGEKFIRQILECCYPSDCGSYNYAVCNKFVETYKNTHIDFNSRISSCSNIC